MNIKLLTGVSIGSGVLVGAATGYMLAKKLYFEKKLQKELVELREYLGTDEITFSNGEPEDEPTLYDDKAPLSEYYERYSTHAVDYTKPEVIEKEEEAEEEDSEELPIGAYHEWEDEDDDEPSFGSFSQLPRPISENDYGSLEDYETVELACTDGYSLFNGDGDKLDPNDVDRFVGLDFASYLDDGQDILYIRNDLYETDYKIIFDIDEEYSNL